MLDAKIAEMSTVKVAYDALNEAGVEVPANMAKSYEKAERGFSYLENNPNASIEDKFSAFAGVRGRAKRSPTQVKLDFLHNRRQVLAEKMEKIEKEERALHYFQDNLGDFEGTIYSVFVDPATDINENFAPIQDRENLEDELNRINSNGYFAVYRKTSKTSRKGTLVGGLLFTALSN